MMNIAQRFIHNKKIVSIFTNRNDTDVFSTGFIKAVTEKELLINHITPLGMYDGYIVKKSDRVYCIEAEGKYEEKIGKLYSFRNQKHENIKIIKDNIMFSVLEFAKFKKLVVSVELFESETKDIQGIILENKKQVIIEKYNDYGERDGNSFINIADISELRCDTEEENVIKILLKI